MRLVLVGLCLSLLPPSAFAQTAQPYQPFPNTYAAPAGSSAPPQPVFMGATPSAPDGIDLYSGRPRGDRSGPSVPITLPPPPYVTDNPAKKYNDAMSGLTK